MTYIVGHRGAPLEAPENTIESFKRAIELGADFFECDIQLSKDGEIVVFHDNILEKLTNGKGFLRDFTFKELRELAVRGKSRIPALKEVLELNFPLLLDLKSRIFNNDIGLDEMYPDLVEKTVGLLEKMNFKKDLILTSFNKDYLRQLERFPRFRKMLNSEYFFDLDEILKELNLYSASFPSKAVNAENIKLIHGKNLKAYIYSVKDRDIKEIINMGADFISTDNPALAVKIRNETEGIKR